MKLFLLGLLVSFSAFAVPQLRLHTPIEIRLHKQAQLPDGNVFEVASFTKEPDMEGFKKATVVVKIKKGNQVAQTVSLNWVTSPQGQNKFSSVKAGPYVIQLLGMKYEKSILVTLFKP
jgi:hypothetical protein